MILAKNSCGHRGNRNIVISTAGSFFLLHKIKVSPSNELISLLDII